MMDTLIFVYGTLMKGFSNNRLLSGSEFVCEARTAPKYGMISLSAFPGMLPSGNTRVHGEVYKVSSATLRALDVLEGHPAFYKRQEIELDGGLLVHGYVLATPSYYRGHDIVTTGDWRTHVRGARR